MNVEINRNYVFFFFKSALTLVHARHLKMGGFFFPTKTVAEMIMFIHGFHGSFAVFAF